MNPIEVTTPEHTVAFIVLAAVLLGVGVLICIIFAIQSYLHSLKSDKPLRQDLMVLGIMIMVGSLISGMGHKGMVAKYELGSL